ncbi:hypothetical protein FS837_010191 [Tulasnella sp. UAMH 9824]|nr:hypothetical protein FS837_010191 [Tulasnella sp. UAMH 9824]
MEPTKENPEESLQQLSSNEQELSVEELDGAAVKRIKICPRQVLESLGHLRIERTRIQRIGNSAGTEGGSADVEAAILVPAQTATCSGSDNTEYVAVKKLRFAEDERDDRVLAASPGPFAHEVKLLNDISHTNVVKIVGFVEDIALGIAWMVFSWEKNGNLREFVRSASWELPERAWLVNIPSNHGSLPALTRDYQIDGVARGLSYLHGRSPPICHGDLKSLNILITAQAEAIITDLGSARALNLTPERETEEPTIKASNPAAKAGEESLGVEIPETGEHITLTGPAWTLRWAAPELVEGGSPGLASDIWAFGWICWETVTGNFPFDEDRKVAVILRIIRGKLPQISDNALFKQVKMLFSLMEECWRLDPTNRPSAVRCQQVVSFMEKAIPPRLESDNPAAIRSIELLCALGRIQQNNGMMAEALKYFEKSIEASKLVGDEWGKAKSMKALGYLCYLQSGYVEAERWYMQARNIYSEMEDQIGLAQSIDGLGDVYYSQNEYSKAEESYIQAQSLFSQVGSQVGYAQSVKSLGDVYYIRSEYSKAEEMYVQARNINSQIGHQLGFAQATDSLGDLYNARGEYSKAEDSFIQARNIYSQIGEQIGFAQSLRSLGDMYRLRSQYTKAEESYIQARNIYSEVNDKLGFTQCVRGLADVYHMRSKYSEAEDLYVQARDIYSQIGHQQGVALSDHGLGEVYRMQGEFPKAENSYIQARKIFSQIGDQLWLAQSVRSLGDVYRMLVEYSKAEELYIQARDISSQIGDQKGSAQALEGMGSLHAAREEHSKAEQAYLEAQEIYLRIGDVGGSANILWYLAWLHRDQARYEEAERFVREASVIYGQLGLEQEVADCDEFLEDIRSLMRENSIMFGWLDSILRRCVIGFLAIPSFFAPFLPRRLATLSTLFAHIHL